MGNEVGEANGIGGFSGGSWEMAWKGFSVLRWAHNAAPLLLSWAYPPPSAPSIQVKVLELLQNLIHEVYRVF